MESKKVFAHYYGTPAKPVREALKAGKSVLLCIDVAGARDVMRKIPGAVSVFIMPPSLLELKKRLAKRGTETDEAARLRLARAREEMRCAPAYDAVIVNDDLDEAARKVAAFLLGRIREKDFDNKKAV